MTPFKLKAPTKDYLWGGNKLRNYFGKTSDTDCIAESWELSCHKDGVSIIDSGEFKGLTLTEYIEKNPNSLGKNSEKFEYFPILIKLIDAYDNLSVQVHPDNEYALEVEGEYGKTEMWYIVDCDEGASLIYGFKNEISRDEFIEAIETNTLLDKVNTVKVKKGDVFFINAGTLHAIGKGILIAEIQQNSNTTYRVYDYGRVGADGNPRELHIKKASEVTDLCPAPVNKIGGIQKFDGYTSQQLSKCEYFTVDKFDIETESSFFADDNSFNHILVLEGNATLITKDVEISITKGESIFIPASTGEYKIHGKCELITTII